jgi:hypothetical protein
LKAITAFEVSQAQLSLFSVPALFSQKEYVG